jgi:hypothetical protein
MAYLVKGSLAVSVFGKSPNKSFEYAPAGSEPLAGAAQFSRCSTAMGVLMIDCASAGATDA